MDTWLYVPPDDSVAKIQTCAAFGQCGLISYPGINRYYGLSDSKNKNYDYVVPINGGGWQNFEKNGVRVNMPTDFVWIDWTATSYWCSGFVNCQDYESCRSNTRY